MAAAGGSRTVSLRRFSAICLGTIGVLIVGTVLYLAFGGLSRHKGRIESFVTQHTGRAFAIDGPFELKVIPAVSVHAERIRLANAGWGSQPQMIQIGQVSTQIGLWSLISGPVDVRTFELRDVEVSMEKGSDGKGNWTFGEPAATDDTESDANAKEAGKSKLPLIIESATINNVRLVYRETGKPERVAQVDTLTIGSGKEGLLAIAGKAKVDELPIALDGEVGPIQALTSGRNIRMAMQASVGKLALDIKGALGRLEPLGGANLSLKGEAADVGPMLTNLRLPIIATGALQINVQLKGAGQLTALNLDATMGDLTAKVSGTLSALALAGSDLKIDVTAANAARLAKVFEVSGVPAAPLTVTGHVVSTRQAIEFDGVSAKLAGNSARADGKIQLTRSPKTDLRFALSADSLAQLREGLPRMKFSAKGRFASGKDKIELSELKAALGENQLTGSLSMTGKQPKHIEAYLASPRLDLSPFFQKEKKEGEGKAKQAAAPKKTQPDEPKKNFVFSEDPLPLDKLKDTDAKLHLAVGELLLTGKGLKDLDATLVVNQGRAQFDARAGGSVEGTLEGSGAVEAVGGGAANMNLNVAIKNLRTGPGVEGSDAGQVPPLGVEMNIKTQGASAHQMASTANGQLLLTQGPGKTKRGFIDVVGGGLVADLGSKLNPFAASDPYTKLECTVARADLVNGKATVKPVLMQSEKVTITAEGLVDLHNEHVTVDFHTRPRKGVGVSPGMFTNPFIRLEGTLASPRVGVGAKGVAAGAVAVATSGVSVLAEGVVDRALGEVDMCGKTLKAATQPNPSEAGQIRSAESR